MSHQPKQILIGSIPKNLVIYVRNGDGFAVDANNKKTIETAKSWADGYGCGVKGKTEHLEALNHPFTGGKLLEVEKRGNGGRAWKVAININDRELIFDLREDVLLETMKEDGIDPGPNLKGTYVFARVGSEMKIIRFGSDTHKQILDYEAQSLQKTIKNFEIGHVYQTKGNKRGLYLGKFWIRPHVFDESYGGWGRDKTVIFSIGEPEEGDVFMIPWSFAKSTTLEEFRGRDGKREYWCGDLEVIKKPTFIREIGAIDVPKKLLEFPSDPQDEYTNLQAVKDALCYSLINISKNKDWIHPAILKYQELAK